MSLLIFFRHGARRTTTSTSVRLGRRAIRILKSIALKTIFFNQEITKPEIEFFFISSGRNNFLLVEQRRTNFDSSNSFEFIADSRKTCFKSDIISS